MTNSFIPNKEAEGREVLNRNTNKARDAFKAQTAREGKKSFKPKKLTMSRDRTGNLR